MPHSALTPLSGAIDFEREKPEQVRHVPKSTAPVNWDALDLVVQRSTGTTLQKQVMRRKFLKAVRTHGIEALTPQFRYSYVCARLALGDFSDYWGWEFRDYAPESGWAARLFWDETWLPKWGGGMVNRLLVLGEQGVGDQLFYASILPEALFLRAKEVIYECDERLHSILTRSLGPRLKCRPELPFEHRRERYGPIDAFIPAADLMRMFRRRRADFPRKPFLIPAQERIDEFEQYRGKIGVAWRGRQGSIDPTKIADRLGTDNLVCIQYKPGAGVGFDVPKLDLWNDLSGLAALVALLDRVVTVPQTVHHIAGAVGVKTDIIVPEQPGEVTNQIQWDYPVGPLPWYADTEVFPDVKTWAKTL